MSAGGQRCPRAAYDAVGESTPADLEALLRQGRAGRPLAATARERRVELAAAGAFLVVAVILAVVAPSAVDFDPALAAVLVLAYAAVTRVAFEFAYGRTDLSLLVLVPMLFLLPARVVPLLVVVAFLLGRLPDYLRGRVHPDRAPNALGDAIHALGPAAVLAFAVDGGPRPADWPWYVLALLAMVACDALAGFGRAWAAHGIRPPLQARALGGVYRLDVLLAPVGLLAAFASEESHYAFLLGAPLVWLLAGYAREREGRLTTALEVGEQRTRRLEAELEAAQAHAGVLGAVSHGLQTPLAGLIGLSRVVEQHDGDLPAARRAELGGALVGHAEDLRQLVRQTLDFQVLRADGELHADLTTVDPGPLVAEVAARVADGRRTVALDVPPDVPAMRADPARVRQILTSLLDNAVRHAPAGTTVAVVVRREDDRVVVEVSDAGPGVPAAVRARLFERPVDAGAGDGSPGTGLGLYVGRALARAMGGDLVLASGPGARFVLRLPRAA